MSKEISVLPDLKLSYLEQLPDSTGDQISLLLLHGFTGSAETMQDLAKTQTTRHTLAPDLIGHDKNADKYLNKKFFSFSSVNLQLENFLDALSLPKIHLLGYSLGARIALNFAISSRRSNIASLTLISGNAGLPSFRQRQKRRRQDQEICKLIENQGLEAFVDFWIAQELFATQAQMGSKWLAKSREQRLKCHPEALRLSLQGLGLGKMKSLWGQLPKFHIPTLLLTGSQDAKFVHLANQLKAQLPDSTHITIPETSHAPHLENPDLVGKHISNFLASIS